MNTDAQSETNGPDRQSDLSVQSSGTPHALMPEVDQFHAQGSPEIDTGMNLAACNG